MCRPLWATALLTAVLGMVPGAVSVAKPPDLPADQEVRCDDDGDAPTLPRQAADPDGAGAGQRPHGPLNTPVGPDLAAPVCLDVWCPHVAPLLVQRLYEYLVACAAAARPAAPVRDASAGDVNRGSAPAPADEPEDHSDSAEQARHLYEIAARCLCVGNLEQARMCLRAAHLANPTCRHGRLAIDRLQKLEAVGDEEASEPPAPATGEPPLSKPHPNDGDETLRRLHRITQPLGTVDVPTY